MVHMDICSQSEYEDHLLYGFEFTDVLALKGVLHNQCNIDSGVGPPNTTVFRPSIG